MILNYIFVLLLYDMQKILPFIGLLLFSFPSFSQGPTANFTASPLTSCVGQTVTFTNTSTAGTAPINSWAWDFGDGNSASAQNTTHIYTNAGTFTVILVVTDTNSLADPEVKTAYITVYPNPVAQFAATANSCTLPVTATYVNQSSLGTNYSYAWNFGNGQSSNLQNPSSITYTTVNTYTASLNVTNTTTGCQSTFSNTITISDFAADFVMVDSVCAGGTVTMDDISTVGVNSWNWTSGAGQSSTNANPTFSYNTAGTYTVTLSSQNTLIGCSATKTKQLVVVPKPVVAFVSNKTHGCLPFNATFSTSTSGCSSYEWTFGDGTTYSGPTPPVHTYATKDTFSVSLTCVGVFGCTATTTRTDYIFTDILDANFIANLNLGCSPITTNYYNISWHDYQTYDPIVSWVWTFDDGSTYNGATPPSDVYTTGLYDLSLTVTTQDGCTDTESKINYIQVGEIDSIDFSSTPFAVCAKQGIDFTDESIISVPHDPSEVKYHWGFGDGGTSINQNVNYGYSLDSGYYDVTFTITFRGCIKVLTKDSIVHVAAPVARFEPSSPLVSFLYPNSFLVCHPGSFPVHIDMADLSTIGQTTDDVKMIWKFFDPLNTIVTFDDPDLDPDDDGSTSFDYPDYGVYQVEQVIYNFTTGCNDSIIETIYISDITPNFDYADSICVDNSVAFSSTSVSVDSLTSYYYSIYSIPPDHPHYSTPSFTHFFDSSATYTVNLKIRNSVGCEDNITLPLVVLADPISSIIPSDVTRCAPITFTFTNGSTSVGNGYSDVTNFTWTFPNGSTQTTSDTSETVNYTYTTQGNFTTTMTATDGFGCVGNTTSAVVHITLPIPNFTEDTVVCDLENFTLVNTSTGVGGVSYQWNIDNAETSTETNLNYFFDETTNPSSTYVPHTITLIATDGAGCIDSISKIMKVSMPYANLEYTATSANLNNNNEASCPPVFETFVNQSTSYGTFNSSWDFGDGKVSFLTTPANTYVFAGVYTLNMQITDQFGCVDDTTFIDYLTIGGPIITYSILPTPDPCDNQFLFDTLSTVNVVSYVWDFGDNTFAADTCIEHNYPAAGTYFTSLTIQDSLGCTVIYPLDTITVNNQITAFFVPSAFTAETSTLVSFDDQSIFDAPGVSWEWNFGDFDNSTLLNNTDESVVHGYEFPFFYTVTLTVTDANGCVDDYQTVIHITGAINAPNVFTPNGDGSNDNFTFQHDIFKSYDVTILNRWGQTLYQNTNETGTYIWNGYTQQGEECSEGVYYYLIRGFLMDDSPFEITGFVTKI
jgi:gliding motility-associated-like protein